MHTKFNLALFAALAIAAVLGAPATAQVGSPAPTKVVRYLDLDLSTEQGVGTLLKRLDVAAAQVCHDQRGQDLQARLAFEACRKMAVNDAVRRTGSARVSDAQLARTLRSDAKARFAAR